MRELCFFCALLSLLLSVGGCVVKEEPYHHYHHGRVYVEETPVVEEKVVEVR